jgi:hypothetical protein
MTAINMTDDKPIDLSLEYTVTQDGEYWLLRPLTAEGCAFLDCYEPPLAWSWEQQEDDVYVVHYHDPSLLDVVDDALHAGLEVAEVITTN